MNNSKSIMRVFLHFPNATLFQFSLSQELDILHYVFSSFSTEESQSMGNNAKAQKVAWVVGKNPKGWGVATTINPKKKNKPPYQLKLRNSLLLPAQVSDGIRKRKRISLRGKGKSKKSRKFLGVKERERVKERGVLYTQLRNRIKAMF